MIYSWRKATIELYHNIQQSNCVIEIITILMLTLLVAYPIGKHIASSFHLKEN